MALPDWCSNVRNSSSIKMEAVQADFGGDVVSKLIVNGLLKNLVFRMVWSVA